VETGRSKQCADDDPNYEVQNDVPYSVSMAAPSPLPSLAASHSSISLVVGLMFALCMGIVLGFLIGYRAVVWKIKHDSGSASGSTISSYDGQSILRGGKHNVLVAHDTTHTTTATDTPPPLDHQLLIIENPHNNIYASPPEYAKRIGQTFSTSSSASSSSSQSNHQPSNQRPHQPPPPPPHSFAYNSATLSRTNPASQRHALLSHANTGTLPRNHRVKQVYL